MNTTQGSQELKATYNSVSALLSLTLTSQLHSTEHLL